MFPDETLQQRSVRRTAARVSRLGVGTAGLGDVFGAVPEGGAGPLLESCASNGVTYLDTAPLYGNGLSERRLGEALAASEQPFVLSTKVGRTLDPSAREGWRFDFSRDAILRGLEGSLERLGRDHVDIVYLHDPDDHEEEIYREAWPTLLELREQGIVKAIGFGMNQWQMPLRFVERLDVDILMIAGRYTLLDPSAGRELLPLCLERGVSVALAGVFNSGILANPVDGAWYDYRPASTELLARARRIRDIAASYQLALPTVALRFALDHPAATTVVVGVGTASSLQLNLDAVTTAVPDDLWATLREELLIP